MNKLAQIRDSEVRGVLAAFVDNGLVKVASRDEFDALSAAVADNIGFDYSISDIAAVTDAIIGGQTKTAAAQYNDATLDDYTNAVGELYLMKTAGQISDDEFAAASDLLMKEAGVFNVGRVGALRKAISRGARKAMKAGRRGAKRARKGVKRNRGKVGLGAGAILGASAGAGAGALYNR